MRLIYIPASTSTSPTIWGKLYNWFAVNDSRGFAMPGWHVPTATEFATLSTYLGGNGVAGAKLRETGTAHWATGNTGTNTSGLTLVGTGYKATNGPITNPLYFNGLWASTDYYYGSAYCRYVQYNDDLMWLAEYDHHTGLSVRLIKDNTTPANYVDYEGNSYPYVVIGSQVWMLHNLNTAFYSNGNAIPQVTDGTTWLNLTTGAWDLTGL